MENVKVILWGLGAMGGGIGKMITKKKGVDIVGAIDIGDKLGKSLYDVVPGMERGDRRCDCGNGGRSNQTESRRHRRCLH